MKQLLVLLVLSLVTCFASSARAGSADYTIDSARSVLTISGHFAGVPLEAQAPGTNSVGYFRELNANRDGDTLELETSHAASLFQTVPLLPGRENGDTDISYGLKVQSPTLGQVLLSTTRLSFYFSTDFRPPLDVSDGTFLASEVGFFLADGAIYYSAAGIERQYVDLHGYGAPNRAAAPGTLTRKGNHETLTIPVATTFSVVTPNGALTLSFTGKIVATRIVPAAVLQAQIPNDLFSLSVATDVGTIMVGAPFADSGKGEVHLYYQANGSDEWQKHQVLKPAYRMPTTMFGMSIALNNNTAAIATYHSPVFIFERQQPGLDWRQTAVIETPDDTSMRGDNISLSDDLLAIGVNAFGDSEQGCVLIYQRDAVSRSWSFVTRVQPDDPRAEAFFGTSVALLGEYLVVGAPGVANDSGAVYAFRLEDGTWRQIQKILPPDPLTGGEFGNSIATNLGQIVISEPGNGGTADTPGRVFLYEVQGLAHPYHWELKQELTPAELLPEKSRFGHRVTIDGNNRDIVVTQLKSAATPDTQDPGSAYVFSLNRSSWSQRARLAPTENEAASSFGVSVANATLRTVIGDYGSHSKPGAVYIYDLTQPPIPPRFLEAPENLRINAPPGQGAEVSLQVRVVDEDGSDLNIRWFIDGIEEYRHFIDGGVPFTEGVSSITHTLSPGVHQFRVVADERDYDGETQHVFTVTVGTEDTVGPVIQSVTANPSNIRAQGARLVLVRLNVQANDPNGPVTWRIKSVQSSDSDRRRPRPDWIIAPNQQSLRVRATTDKRKIDRVYTIQIEARDSLGNTAVAQTTVTIVAEGKKPGKRRLSLTQ